MADLPNPNASSDRGNSDNGPKVDLSGIKKKRGRPPGSGKTGNNDAPKSGAGRESAAPDAALDAGFLADAVCYLFETCDELLARKALGRIQKLFPDKIAEFEELQKQAGLTERDLGLVRKCVLRIAAKYDVVAKFAPEILLIGLGAQYCLRQSRVFARISDLERKVLGAKNITPTVEPAKS